MDIRKRKHNFCSAFGKIHNDLGSYPSLDLDYINS